jgi:hypothetical protein
MAADADSGQSSPSSPLSSPPSSVLSSPLSSPANSPSPPPEMPPPRSQFRIHLPSPPSSQSTSQSGSPAPDGMDSSTNSDKDDPPPTKRRRISKERTTGYLDLRRREVDPEQQPELDRLLKVLTKSQKVVVIAGAGISVSAGSEFSLLDTVSIRSTTLTTCYSPRFSVKRRPLQKPPGRAQTQRLRQTSVRRVSIQG